MASSFSTTVSFYIFGVACLSAWNFFITPQSYWNAKLANHNATSNSTELNPYQQFWDSSLSGKVFIEIRIPRTSPRCSMKKVLENRTKNSTSVAICGVQFTFCCVGTALVNCFSRKCRFIFCFTRNGFIQFYLNQSKPVLQD